MIRNVTEVQPSDTHLASCSFRLGTIRTAATPIKGTSHREVRSRLSLMTWGQSHLRTSPDPNKHAGEQADQAAGQEYQVVAQPAGLDRAAPIADDVDRLAVKFTSESTAMMSKIPSARKAAPWPPQSHRPGRRSGSCRSRWQKRANARHGRTKHRPVELVEIPLMNQEPVNSRQPLGRPGRAQPGRHKIAEARRGIIEQPSPMPANRITNDEAMA